MMFLRFTNVVACVSTSSPFNGRIVFHCVDILQFLIHLSVDRHLSCFYFLAVMNSAAVNIHAQVFVWTYFFECSCSCFVFSRSFQDWEPLNSVYISGPVERRVPV